MKSMTPVRLLVVGGYLGSGKSTLANQLLQGWHAGSAGIIINDLAPVNVDAEYVIEHRGPTVAMQDGCVCCSISSMLGAALDKLLAHRPALHTILLEASGVSDPARVAVYGHGWPGLAPHGVITVVDASDFEARSNDKYVGALVRRQVESAELVLVNKADTVSSRALTAVRELVVQLAPAARVLTTVRGVSDGEPLLPIARAHKRGLLRAWSGPDAGVGRGRMPAENFETYVFRSGPLDLEAFSNVADALQASAKRFKGVLVDSRNRKPFLVQSTGDRLEIVPQRHPGEYRETVLVFIVSGEPEFAAEQIERLSKLLARLRESVTHAVAVTE